MPDKPSDSLALSEEQKLVTFERHDDALFEDDLLSAFKQADQNLADQDGPMRKFIDFSAVSNLTWENPQLEVRTKVWGYPLRITSDYIIIYSAE
ncbi:hypothetical protein B4589_009250 [Halolamina sp. CBA1230]|uniref:hypothetical protein n=1 Tax=Halolamina sp. CBA1230 TaxID=1853690 RepID=UPI00117A0B57|nr:hypothetical protein [Halolamina sp. CBA1230]QKY20553.1 hypothetical protein B4589_009250 [Halolamina sp. CBA1230]